MDFYIVLGLDRSASLGDVKRAYRRLARRYHPDVNPGDRTAEIQFRQILEAYETLSDPDRRRRYDVTGVVAVTEEQAAYGFEGFDFSVSAEGAAASTFGDLFGELLRQRTAPSSPNAAARGADLHQTITLGFLDTLHDTIAQLTVTRLDRCRSCEGTGVVEAPERRCAHCHGAGAIRSARGHMVFSKQCEHCEGTGRQINARCPQCNGQQAQMRTEPLTISVPAGLADGARIRVPGKGHAGMNGGESGDLYVTVRVEPHRLFRRDGDDVHVTVPVAIHEAALGARVEIPSLDGTAPLRIPPGTQSGQRFRLRGLGMPSMRDGQRGDLVAEVRVVLPAALDDRSKELLREFGRINSDDVRKGMTR
jgi:molecular chaperone DnaJ